MASTKQIDSANAHLEKMNSASDIFQEIAINSGIALVVTYFKTIAKSDSLKRKMKNVAKRLFDAIKLAYPEFE